ncbi:MAG TPA: hypothetical protein VLN91_04395 [Nitrospirota bacterium]|nr:hypothetical protein [Nitrospirota bacterium]
MSSAVKKTASYSTNGTIKMRCSSCLWGKVAVRKGDREIAVMPQAEKLRRFDVSPGFEVLRGMALRLRIEEPLATAEGGVWMGRREEAETRAIDDTAPGLSADEGA